MISVWLGDRSGWTGVRLAELDRSSFVDRSAGSWIGALVCGSELVLSGSWIRALCVDRSSLVHGSELWFVDRSSFSLSLCVAVRGSELSGSWIGVDRSSGLWIEARSLCVCICFVFLFSLSLYVAVRGE